MAVRGMASEEKWSGIKISVGHLRVFGYDAWVHTSYDWRTKLQLKRKKCTFIRCNEAFKGHSLCDPTTQRVVESRDMRFDEETLSINADSFALTKFLDANASLDFRWLSFSHDLPHGVHGRYHGEHGDGYERDLRLKDGDDSRDGGLHLDGKNVRSHNDGADVGL